MERCDWIKHPLLPLQTLTELQIASAAQLNTVIFKDKAAAPVGRKFISLFPGLGYAAGYKVRFNEVLQVLPEF